LRGVQKNGGGTSLGADFGGGRPVELKKHRKSLHSRDGLHRGRKKGKSSAKRGLLATKEGTEPPLYMWGKTGGIRGRNEKSGERDSLFKKKKTAISRGAKK